MKKTFFLMALLCLITTASFAQYNTLTINNTSSCTVYLQLYGTTFSSGCMADYGSNILAIPPGTVTYADPTMVPGGMTGTGGTLNVNDNFTMVRVLNGPYMYSCFTPTAYMLSDCIPGATSNVSNVQFFGYDPFTGCYKCPSPGVVYDLWYNPTGPTTVTLEIF